MAVPKDSRKYETWKEKIRQAHLKRLKTGKTRTERLNEQHGDKWEYLYCEEGFGTSRIAKMFGMYPDDVYGVLKMRGVTIRSPKENGTNLWNDPALRDRMSKAIIRGNRFKQTEPEQIIERLLDDLFSGEYVFVGDGRYSIGGKCPDFLNITGKKKIIEVFGEWHHHEDNPQERIDFFKEYGWDCLIIWQHELQDLDLVTQKLRNFHGCG